MFLKTLFILLVPVIILGDISIGIKQKGGMNIGISQTDPEEGGGGCDSNLSTPSMASNSIAPDSFSVACSLICGASAAIKLVVSSDKSDTVFIDSVAGIDSPARYIDTAYDMASLTKYYYRVMTTTDDGSDTTGWDSITTDGYCVTDFGSPDTTKTWADAIAFSTDITMPYGGRVISKIAGDTSGTIEYDTFSIAIEESPKTITDTSDGSLIPSTVYYYELIDTCGNSSGWDSVYTQDSTGYSDSWLHIVAPSISSANPATVAPEDITYVLGTEFKATEGSAWLNDIAVIIDSWADDSISFTVPSELGSGTYDYRMTDVYGYSDTLVDAITVDAGTPDSFTVTVTTAGTGTGSTALSPLVSGNKYETGTEVTLTMTPDPYNKLVLSDTIDVSPYVFTITSDTTLNVTFDAFPTYTVDTSGITGSGSIVIIPEQLSFDSSEICTLTTLAETGYSFLAWTGDNTSSDDSLFIAMDDNKSISASFVEIPIIVSIANTKPLNNWASDVVIAGDTAKVAATGVRAYGASTAFRLNSTGSVMATIIESTWDAVEDTFHIIIPSAPAGVYFSRFQNDDGILSATDGRKCEVIIPGGN